MKTCVKCKIEKSFSEFHKYAKGKDGLKNQCKVCISEYTRAYYEANKENKKAYSKAYREANKDKIKVYNKSYSKTYREANKERLNAKNLAYQKERIKKDSLFRLKRNLSGRTRSAFRNKGYRKDTKTQEILGVDWEVTKMHIERQFKKGMTWGNYGEWHIDHIIPLASANTEKQLMRLCHYTNLQPLWAEQNLTKSDSILGQQTKLRV